MADNIFDILGKGSKPKHSLPLNKGNFPSAKKPSNAESEAIEQMFKKMRTMEKDLANQLADLYLQGKMQPQIEALLMQKLGALNKKQIEDVAEQERILKEKISQAIPPESCLRKNPKSKEKMTQERRGKMRGAKNKWIPMR
jgi:hypothetical protein